MARFIDDLDRGIVRLLEQDGRMANLEIARRLGVSEATIRKRIARLIRQQGVRIVASVGGPARATEMLFLIHTEAGCRLAVAEQLAALPDVEQVSLTTGSYDVVVRAAFRSDAEALDFLVEQIEGTTGVRSVQANHVLKNLKPAMPANGHRGAIGRLDRTAALDAFVLEAVRAPDLAAVAALGCDAALAGLGVDRAAVFVLDEAKGRPTYLASRGLSAEYLEKIEDRVSPRVGVGIRVVNTRVHVCVEDARASPLMAGMQDLVLKEGYRTLLVLPLLYGEVLVGLITLYNDAIRRYQHDEIALAQVFADQLAIAIVRAGGGSPARAGDAAVATSPAELLIDRLSGLGG